MCRSVSQYSTTAAAFASILHPSLIMALVVFLIVKALNRATAKFVPAEEKKEEAPTSKLCPMCKTEIAIDACRCPHCTSILDAVAMHEREAGLPRIRR